MSYGFSKSVVSPRSPRRGRKWVRKERRKKGSGANLEGFGPLSRKDPPLVHELPRLVFIRTYRRCRPTHAHTKLPLISFPLWHFSPITDFDSQTSLRKYWMLACLMQRSSRSSDYDIMLLNFSLNLTLFNKERIKLLWKWLHSYENNQQHSTTPSLNAHLPSNPTRRIERAKRISPLHQRTAREYSPRSRDYPNIPAAQQPRII